MKLEWTEQALEGFHNIRSLYYTPFETAEYKKRLLENIQENFSPRYKYCGTKRGMERQL